MHSSITPPHMPASTGSGPATKRAVLDGTLTPAECSVLLLIARCCSSVGYRASHCAATVIEIARIYPPWLVHMSLARQKVRAAAEEALGVELGLLIEFTGLQSWRPGSSISWYYDSSRPYLAYRRFAAVAYLNTAGRDFQGGTFAFQTGDPSPVFAAPGRVVAYSAHHDDVHSVTPVTAGERFTLTLWFTTQPEHDEDAKLLCTLPEAMQAPLLPPPCSMYALPDGCDLRLCRLAMMGLGLAACGAEVGRTLLNSLEHAEGCSVEVVLHGPSFARWSGRAAERPSLPQLLLLPIPQFPDAAQAISFLQHWAWQERGSAWGTEAVCSSHLSQGGAAGAHCGWLRHCCGQELPARDDGAAGEGPEDPCLPDLLQALQGYGARRQHEGLEWAQAREQWLQLGAVT